jgi:hypothetical protein
MIRGNTWNHLLCIAGFAVAHSGISSASDEAVRIKQGTDLPAVWKKDQHLYLKGTLGVSSSKLNALEKWLDQNAPNWTVVLMVNAQGERFT